MDYVMRTTATLRKLGGSVVIAIPPAFLDNLNCVVGDRVDLALNNGLLEVRPQKKRLTLAERLKMFEAAVSARTEAERQADREWDGAPSQGSELL